MTRKRRKTDPCPCGSGKMYKHCCLPVKEAAQEAARQAALTPLQKIFLAIDRGYKDKSAACEHWLPAWEGLQALLTPEMRTLDAADRDLRLSEFVLTWTTDLAMELNNAAIDDPAFAEKGIAYHRQFLAQFTEEDQKVRDQHQADLALQLARAGRTAEAEGLCRELIEKAPDRSLGYIFLRSVFQCSSGASSQPSSPGGGPRPPRHGRLGLGPGASHGGPSPKTGP